MPRIQEYTQEVDAAGPVGGLAPNIEQATMYGRGIEKFSNEVGGSVETLMQRQAQSETSEAYATAAQARVEFNTDLQDSINDGSLDIDKVKSKYQDWVQKQQENYSTPAGKNFFNRQAARLGGQLLRTAGKGQALIAGKNAVGDLQNAMVANTNSLETDPSQFADLHDSALEYLNQKVDEGTIHAADAPRFQKEIGIELSKAALRGYAQVDPETAKQALAKGAFDEYLDSDHKKQMSSEIHQYEVAKEVEMERSKRLAKAAKQEAFESWEQKALPDLVSNKLSTQDILKAPGTAEQKYKWIQMSRTAQKENLQTDPAHKNELLSRMLLPSNDSKAIVDPSQLQDEVVSGKLSPTDYTSMTAWFDKTPRGQALNANRKSLVDIARKTLVNTGFMGSGKDPSGEFNLNQFVQSLQHEEENMRQKKEPISSLYDVNSKNYFGNRIRNFSVTPEQRLKQMATQIKNEDAEPKNVYNPPGINPADTTKPPQEEMVPMTNTKGAPVKVPKSKADAAEKAGYKKR